MHAERTLSKVFFVLVGVIVLSVLFIVYSTHIEPSNLEVNRYRIKFFGGVDDSVKLKIALISDLHVRSPGDGVFLDRVVAKLNEVDADYIVIGGDVIEGRREEISSLTPLLGIADKNHTLVVLGNHDYSWWWDDISLADELTSWFESGGFTVLRNENFVYGNDEVSVCFVGVDEVWSGQIDLDRAYSNLDLDCKVILLSHNPDVVFKLDERRTDLILSGHNHGGYVCLPLVGALWIPSKIRDGCGRGFYEINNRRLFITGGVGGIIRFNSKPEIAVLELT